MKNQFRVFNPTRRLNIAAKVENRSEIIKISIKIVASDRNYLIKPGNKRGRNLKLLNELKFCHKVKKPNL